MIVDHSIVVVVTIIDRRHRFLLIARLTLRLFTVAI